MNIIENRSAETKAENIRLYIENLLAKYPATTDQEEREILTFIVRASALEAALMTCNDGISEKLKAFKHKHRKQLGLTLRNWISFAGLLGLIALTTYLMWDLGI